jgi:hypothetical protein
MINIIQENSLFLQKITKYIFIFIIIFVSTKNIPNEPINDKEVFMISMIGAITFAILDLVSPSITIKTNSDD